MEKITLGAASKLTSPNPVTLICTQKPDGSTNLATVSWWTYVSFNPGTIVYAMSKKSYSGQRVRATGKVVLTIPGEAIADAVMVCGSCSGRDTDKVEKGAVELQELPDCEIKVPLHSRVAIQCSLKEYLEVGDHYLYVCDVEQVFGCEDEVGVYAWNGYGEIRPAK